MIKQVQKGWHTCTISQLSSRSTYKPRSTFKCYMLSSRSWCLLLRVGYLLQTPLPIVFLWEMSYSFLLKKLHSMSHVPNHCHIISSNFIKHPSATFTGTSTICPTRLIFQQTFRWINHILWDTNIDHKNNRKNYGNSVHLQNWKYINAYK